MNVEPLLQVKDLRTIFHTGKRIVHAVNNISFSLSEGETLGIVGESGSGKSVTMMSILRLIPSPPGQIAGGEVWFDGCDLLTMHRPDIRKIRGKEISMIFQDPMTSLNPVLTIGRHLYEPLEMHLGLTRPQAIQRAVELLDLVGIPDAKNRLNDYPYQFSGGMRQRVMIALALSCNPRLLIADEPTTALDVTVQSQIIDLVKQLRDEIGMSIIWITHDLGIVAGLVDRIIVLYAGMIMEVAQTDELYNNPRHPYTIGLLNAVPRLDTAGSQRLIPIPGRPPNLLDPPPGCPFAPRCFCRGERCLTEKPPLVNIASQHQCACWIDRTAGQTTHPESGQMSSNSRIEVEQ